MANNSKHLLAFEKPLADLYTKLDELREISQAGKMEMTDEIRLMEKRIEGMRREIFSNLTPIQIVQVARHMQRPTTLD
ncbi:MAG: acetyl-CoA carboxylase carboxyl transferase subunit alpha, partial [bacterium]